MSAEELQSLQNYLKENDVEELILGLVEATLREKPESPCTKLIGQFLKIWPNKIESFHISSDILATI